MEEKGKEIKDIHIFRVYCTVYNLLTRQVTFAGCRLQVAG